MLQTITKVLLLFAVGTWICGCDFRGLEKPTTSNTIPGRYVLNYQGLMDELDLRADGTFRQVITYVDGKRYPFTGTWKFSSPNKLIFDGNYRMPTGDFGKLYPPDKSYGDGRPERATVERRTVSIQGTLSIVVDEEHDIYYQRIETLRDFK